MQPGTEPSQQEEGRGRKLLPLTRKPECLEPQNMRRLRDQERRTWGTRQDSGEAPPRALNLVLWKAPWRPILLFLPGTQPWPAVTPLTHKPLPSGHFQGQPCSGTSSIHERRRQPLPGAQVRKKRGGLQSMSEGQQGGDRGTVCAKVLRPGLRDVWGQVEAKGEGWTVSGLWGHSEGFGCDGTGLGSQRRGGQEAHAQLGPEAAEVPRDLACGLIWEGDGADLQMHSTGEVRGTELKMARSYPGDGRRRAGGMSRNTELRMSG